MISFLMTSAGFSWAAISLPSFSRMIVMLPGSFGSGMTRATQSGFTDTDELDPRSVKWMDFAKGTSRVAELLFPVSLRTVTRKNRVTAQGHGKQKFGHSG